MKTIPLSQGQVALVDDEDYNFLMQWKWAATKGNNTFYAQRTDWKGGKPKTILMHRLILRTPSDLFVDHKDHNGLNNQKDNIRNCTPSQNQFNRTKNKKSNSKYAGVSFEKDRNKWGVRIQVDGKHLRVGRFDTEIEAAVAYNSAAKKHYGQFANPNQI